jgi:hypothetical protein
MNNTQTADGLRDRLFGALDGLIDGSMDVKVVEHICYVSEQIIKTAKVEMEMAVTYAKLRDEEENRRTLAVNQLGNIMGELNEIR